jgi:RNA polymerase sigma-70 factor (ECF subfamily)
MADGPEAAPPLLDELAADGALNECHLRPAARADLLRRARRGDEVRASYQAAIGLAPAEADRHYPQRRCDL